MADVFVSYKAEDRARVKPLVHALEEDGFSVWWDEQIGGGASWRQAIEAELEAAKCVVVMWSKRSAGPEGAFVQDEAARGQQRHVYVPVLIDNVRLPLGFGETQALPLTGWHGDRSDARYAAVLSAVNCIAAGRRPVSLHRERTGALFSRRAAVIGSGAVLLGAAGVSAFLLRPRGSSGPDSIAVLPFDNLSGDPAQAYFSDGIAEELRSALARIPELKVVARTSSEAVRNEDARTAALKLGVAHILTGSVRRSPSLIRVSTQLVDGGTGLERWSQDFDQPAGDPLAIQSNIAERVAEALQVQLGEAAKAALTLGGTRNPAAQDLYLKAVLGRADDSPAGYQRSLAELDAAMQLDPTFGRAFARKAATLALYTSQYTRSPAALRADLDEAAATARRSIALAPRLAQAHAALGLVDKLQLNFTSALSEMEAAVALPGADAETIGRYANLLAQLNRGQRAQAMMQKAISLDPLNPKAYEQEAVILYLGHQLEGAVAASHRALQLAPTATFVRGFLGYSLALLGRYQEATAEIAKLPSDSWQNLTVRAIIAARTGDKAAFSRAVQQLHSDWGDSVNYEFAEIYAQAGDADTAIDYLKRPVSQHDPGFIFIVSDPCLDPIRHDPRLTKIIKGLNLPT